jgi:hypothetical protein
VDIVEIVACDLVTISVLQDVCCRFEDGFLQVVLALIVCLG